jgi:nucleoside-diphosphate-sugar epimerase
MRVLVVAGTGFIGGHVARAFLERGDQVCTLVRSSSRAALDPRLSGARIVEGDAAQLPQQILDESQDVVVYAAGVWRQHEHAPPAEVARRCEEVYVQGVTRLSERASAWNAHFIFLSGISRYGDAFLFGPVKEDAPAGRLSVYGAAKRKSEAILARREGLRWTAIVPPEVYGSHDRGGYVRFVYERVRSRRFVLLGAGDNRWTLCNVKNVADAIVHVAPRDGAGPLHVADARPSSQREIAAGLARALGRRPLFPRVPRSVALGLARLNAAIPRREGAREAFSPAHVRVRTATLSLDTSRASALGFEPRFGLEQGLSEAVAWWES